MKIFVTGLCTLHWGRLEYGNVGNYYIVEPLFRELHRVFPNADIVTTFQMTEDFVKREKITVLPMNYYYSWDSSDLPNAIREYGAAEYYRQYGYLPLHSGFIDTILESGLVVNVSGDMWGDNAESVGHERFFVDLLKMRTAQLLNRKTVLFAGTPGPFSDDKTRQFAKEVFESFDFVPNREEMATINLVKWGFDTSKVENFACPSFLFEPASQDDVAEIFYEEGIPYRTSRPTIGFTVCGFNMQKAPYDLWPRDDQEFEPFVEAIEYIINNIGARVVLVSHTNGFDSEPNFRLKPGRDYQINRQLYDLIKKRGMIKDQDDLYIVRNPYIPKYLRALIGSFDLFVTGRLHASVASTSQFVPTVYIMHGKQFIRSTKIIGFARLCGLETYVCEPYDSKSIISRIQACWDKREEINIALHTRIPEIQQKARSAFDAIAELVSK